MPPGAGCHSGSIVPSRSTCGTSALGPSGELGLDQGDDGRRRRRLDRPDLDVAGPLAGALDEPIRVVQAGGGRLVNVVVRDAS
jgi:hypothetical protein